eukprot:TRINITY_DN13654_c1_g1_i1.p1 TRINITY_DN13654_c1_g1~~TRINITY_DN13654_c1_g1_i1.p1  ORF type:complete len:195 (-),score=22.17 TRINITY_DN13654_c1_g1_i1:107-691(-)
MCIRDRYYRRIYEEFEFNRKLFAFHKFRQICRAQHSWVIEAHNVLLEKELLLYFNCLKLHTLYKKYKRRKVFLLAKKAFQALRNHNAKTDKRKGVVAWYYSMMHKSFYAFKVFLAHNKGRKAFLVRLIKKLQSKRAWKKWKQKRVNVMVKNVKANSTRQRYIGITITQRSKLISVRENESFILERRDRTLVTKK